MIVPSPNDACDTNVNIVTEGQATGSVGEIASPPFKTF